MSHIIRFWVPLCLLFASSAHAQEATPLSLGQAIQKAVEGNAELKKEKARIAIADAHITRALGPFDVLVGGGISQNRRVTPLVCRSDDPTCTKDPGSGAVHTTAMDVSVTRALETGGQLRLSGQASRVESQPALTTDATSTDRTTYRSGLTLTFSHPLLRGLGREVTEANLRRARIERSQAEQNRRLAACNVLRDVVTRYWELAYASQDLEIRRSALDLAKEQLRITQAMIEVGRLAQSDSASVERAIAQREEDVATALQGQYYRSLDLARLIGIHPDANTPRFSAIDRPQTSPPVLHASADIERALAANPQLASLRLGLTLTETDLAAARNTLRPKLDLLASVGPVGRSLSGLGNALDQTLGFGNIDFSAGLSFEVPVQNRIARGDVAALRETLALSLTSAQDFEAQLRDLVLRTASNIATSAKRAEFGQREVEFAKRNLEAEQARFQVGRSTNNDVLLRQQELKDAEIRLLRSTVDQLVSEAALAATTAEILDRYGIVLKGW